MRSFKDREGREWLVAIDYGAIKRIKGLTSGSTDGAVNLAGPADGSPPLSVRLQTDIVLFCDTLYALCKPQAEAKGVTDEQFGQALGGDAIYAAWMAFFEEWAAFFRQLHQTQNALLVEKGVALVKAQAKAMEKVIATVEPEALVESLTQKALSDASSKLRELLGSTQTA